MTRVERPSFRSKEMAEVSTSAISCFAEVDGLEIYRRRDCLLCSHNRTILSLNLLISAFPPCGSFLTSYV
ncbi:hypothetical protein GCK32_001873 [Trichostrongylus colubriformis]|uniref:Uncharacterized protein n=1 Tax=Trichostrongylus colubriformis TaxID=6319 RepID=A0AAN8IXE7_TRICO